MSDTTSNGGTVQSGFTTVCTDCTAGTGGNSVSGDYELTFTLDTSFTHSYGGLIIRFSDGASMPSDSTCSQVVMSGSSSDSSGYFVQRFYADSDGLSTWDGSSTDYIAGFELYVAPTPSPTVSSWSGFGTLSIIPESPTGPNYWYVRVAAGSRLPF